MSVLLFGLELTLSNEEDLQKTVVFKQDKRGLYLNWPLLA